MIPPASVRNLAIPLLALALGISGSILGEPQPRLPTDAALQAGMENIRAAVVDHHTLITHRRLPPAMAASFARRIEGSIAAIRDGTILSGDARTRLDALLDTIKSAAQMIGMSGDSVRQIEALFTITRTLESYQAEFDHPGWKPLQDTGGSQEEGSRK